MLLDVEFWDCRRIRHAWVQIIFHKWQSSVKYKTNLVFYRGGKGATAYCCFFKVFNRCSFKSKVILPVYVLIWTLNMFFISFFRDKEYLFDFSSQDVFTPTIRSRIVEFLLKRKRFSDDEDQDFAFGEKIYEWNSMLP